MEFLHISLALVLGICQPVLVLKQYRGDFITFVIVLNSDYNVDVMSYDTGIINSKEKMSPSS